MAVGSTLSRRPRRSPRATPPSKPREGRKGKRDPLLAAICHDLRAPLAAVTMGTNFVLQTLGPEESNARSRRILEAMLRSCNQMERLVRNFADLSEIDGNAVALRLGDHDAGEMLELAADSARETARTRSVTIDVVKPKASIIVHCDRERLLRAIQQVLDNAVRFAPEGSTVTLGAGVKNTSVSFTAVDHGPGLSPEVRKNLFDRQWHAKRASRAGAGFGLAIARGFAEAHGGRVTVESRPGTTTFGIVLPRGSAERPRVTAARRPRR